jgi:putative acetyltransferase
MQIRPATFPHDLPDIKSLFEEYAQSLNVSLCFQNFGEELATLPCRYAAPRGGVWLAEGSDTVAGCVAMRPLTEYRAEMKRLYVRPPFRGKGLGEKLTQTVLDAAKALGYRELCLDTLPLMQKAIALYRTMGFEEIEPYYENPVQGAFFMKKTLGTFNET